MCKADASLLWMLAVSTSPMRGAPHLPQNCSSSMSGPPHFQQAQGSATFRVGAATFLPDFIGGEASARGPAKAARLGLIFSIAANIEDRSAAIDFFSAAPASRLIAFVTRPAMSWQV